MYKNQIITSLLDTDAYKLYMQQAVFHHYKDIEVEASFICRGGEKLFFLASKIEKEIKALCELSLTKDEYEYLSSFEYFQKDYLEFLKTYKLKSSLIQISEENKQLNITIKGKWLDVILWEVPLLAIISELYHKSSSYNEAEVEKKALEKLEKKLEIFENSNLDFSSLKILDFGTRRRFSKDIQEKIVTHLKKNFNYFAGTSNLYLAMKKNLNVVGTQAHEWFQAHQQISEDLVHFQKDALKVWLKEYPNSLKIALTDCLNMDTFLKDFEEELSNSYLGLRHDSADPFIWGDKAISHYKKLNINPKDKTLVFSDSLTFEKIIDIYSYFKGKTNTSFGIGTKLTCDIPDFMPLNIVIKLTKCNGKPVAKISDEPGKTTSKDKKFVEDLKNTFKM